MAGLCSALVVVGAKAHGRQVRLARERVGITKVVFGADNGPVVEAIWRHDRIRFWTGVGMVAILFAAVVGFASGFIAAGLTAWMGQMRPQPGDPQWLERANWVSLAWWTLVGVLVVLIRFAV